MMKETCGKYLFRYGVDGIDRLVNDFLFGVVEEIGFHVRFGFSFSVDQIFFNRAALGVWLKGALL